MLLDRDSERLATVEADLVRAHPEIGVSTYLVDLADPAATDQTAAAVARNHPGVTQLVNNAGVDSPAVSIRSAWSTSTGCWRSTSAPPYG